MSKFQIGDSVIISDRGMKTNSFKGIITGIEPTTDRPVYNVLVEMRNNKDQITGVNRNVNFLEHQLAKDLNV